MQFCLTAQYQALPVGAEPRHPPNVQLDGYWPLMHNGQKGDRGVRERHLGIGET